MAVADLAPGRWPLRRVRWRAWCRARFMDVRQGSGARRPLPRRAPGPGADAGGRRPRAPGGRGSGATVAPWARSGTRLAADPPRQYQSVGRVRIPDAVSRRRSVRRRFRGGWLVRTPPLGTLGAAAESPHAVCRHALGPRPCSRCRARGRRDRPPGSEVGRPAASEESGRGAAGGPGTGRRIASDPRHLSLVAPEERDGPSPGRRAPSSRAGRRRFSRHGAVGRRTRRPRPRVRAKRCSDRDGDAPTGHRRRAIVPPGERSRLPLPHPGRCQRVA